MTRDDRTPRPSACEDLATLVPSYVDGELSEAQAAPLRRHLLACPACREVAKELRALRAWFAPEPAPAVPPGFAARVARRALAGDRGLEDAPAPASTGGDLLPFVLRVTAAAAALLFVLALGIALEGRPSPSEGLAAEDLDGVWQEIYGEEAPAEAALPLPPPAPRDLSPPLSSGGEDLARPEGR